MGDVDIHGSCASGFDGVRDAFEQNFLLRNEVGAAVAVWVDGDLVVNLWGGSADAAGSRPWQQDTLGNVLSGSKGLTSTCVHQLADRGRARPDAPVARYWPEFAQAGKEAITVAMVLSHRSGVIGPPFRMNWWDVGDWDYVCRHIGCRRNRGGSPAPPRAISWPPSASSSARCSVVSPAARSGITCAPRSPSRWALTCTSVSGGRATPLRRPGQQAAAAGDPGVRAPWDPVSLDRAPEGGHVRRDGISARRRPELSRHRSAGGRSSSPPPMRTSPRWEWPPSTTGWPWRSS